MDKFLAPSILTADFSNLAQQIRAVEIGGADWIHCDIMDGKFVPNLTFGPVVVNSIKKVTKLKIDAHLMVENPDNLIEAFAKAGVDYLTVHQEASIHLNRTLHKIKEFGIKAGVAINPSTPINFLSEVLDLADLILVMTVNPGFGGQKFIPNSIKKIEELSKLKIQNNFDFLIQTDGGINKENILSLSNAGCNAFVVGNSIYSSDNITAATIELKNIIS